MLKELCMLDSSLVENSAPDASTKIGQANAAKAHSVNAVMNENVQVNMDAAITEAPREIEEDTLDRLLHAREARFTFSQSLESLTLAFLDWGLHLANAPGRRITLAESAARQWARLLDKDLWAK